MKYLAVSPDPNVPSVPGMALRDAVVRGIPWGKQQKDRGECWVSHQATPGHLDLWCIPGKSGKKLGIG